MHYSTNFSVFNYNLYFLKFMFVLTSLGLYFLQFFGNQSWK